MATADELKDTLASASREDALAILNEENASEKPRSTVVAAAEARIAELDLPGEPQEGTPDGRWAQLLDEDGKPVQVDGNPVAAEVTP